MKRSALCHYTTKIVTYSSTQSKFHNTGTYASVNANKYQ